MLAVPGASRASRFRWSLAWTTGGQRWLEVVSAGSARRISAPGGRFASVVAVSTSTGSLGFSILCCTTVIARGDLAWFSTVKTPAAAIKGNRQRIALDSNLHPGSVFHAEGCPLEWVNAGLGVWRGGRVRLIAHDSKSCRGHTLVGSNPTLSVINVDAVHSIESYVDCWTFFFPEPTFQ